MPNGPDRIAHHPAIADGVTTNGTHERELLRDALKRSMGDATVTKIKAEFVYRTGRPLPLRVVDDAIRQVREERAQHILGKHS